MVKPPPTAISRRPVSGDLLWGKRPLNLDYSMRVWRLGRHFFHKQDAFVVIYFLKFDFDNL